jgi:2-oxoglutarate ferredoxin oxidoreductase subunit gamma
VTAATQVRFAGFGGQGIVLAGALLGKAASLFDGREAVFTQSYGPEARGGASRADIIIADEPVDYPYVTEPDILVVMFQEAWAKFGAGLGETGVLLIESELVDAADAAVRPLALPAVSLAEQLGSRIVANVVMLGGLVGATAVVRREAVEQAIRDTLKPSLVDLNLQALALGIEAVTTAEAAV